MKMGASDVGDGHRRRRSWTSCGFVPMAAKGGVAKARSTKCALRRRFPPQNHTQISRLFFYSQEKAVLRRWKSCAEPLHRQPPEHVFVHDSIQRLHLATSRSPWLSRVSLFSLILGFSVRSHASTQDPFRVTGGGP
jgi:hypothetical protein